jgi:hypothetical protein
MAVFWDVALCSVIDIDQLFRVLTAAIIRAMKEAVSSSQTFISIFRTTQCNIQEDRHHLVIIITFIYVDYSKESA